MFLGLPELLIVLVIVLVIFGPKRLPGLGRSLGGGIRSFKDGLRGEDRRRESLPRVTEEGEPVNGEVIRERRP